MGKRAIDPLPPPPRSSLFLLLISGDSSEIRRRGIDWKICYDFGWDGCGVSVWREEGKSTRRRGGEEYNAGSPTRRFTTEKRGPRRIYWPEREREENLCEDSHKFWQVVLLAMKNQNFSFQAPPSFFRVSRNETRRSKLVQRKTRQGSSRREKTRRSVSNSTIISCVGPEIASKIEGARRERGDANRSSFFSFSPLDASEPRQISPLFISSPSALLF